jgi:hypothetical protein
MNTTLTFEMAAVRQSDLLRESAHRRLAAQASRARGESVWSRLLPWRAGRWSA